jgi:sec-independent protein translocase protein TatB
MFDFAWSEIMLIGAVALIAIGPKDMPAAIRTVTGMIKKARRMASEFQTHVDEMVKEAELGDVKSAFNDLRRMDIPSAMEKMVDPDRSIRKTFEDNPLESYSAPTTPVAAEPIDPLPPAEEPVGAVAEPPAEPEGPLAPAFIPPNLIPKAVPAMVAPPEAPAFVPPGMAQAHQASLAAR